MATISQNRIIHRFIRPIADYKPGGTYFHQVVPIDTQAYAYYPNGERDVNLWYVFGDGIHTYDEIVAGKGFGEQVKEFPVFTAELLELINKQFDCYTKEEVDALIAAIPTFEVKVVDVLPEVGQSNILYLIPCGEPDSELNWYDEYLWLDNKWEEIGNSKGGGVKPEDLTAQNITYDYSQKINSVEKALNLLMDSGIPVLTAGKDTIVEKGTEIVNVNLSWQIKPEWLLYNCEYITIQPGDIRLDPGTSASSIWGYVPDDTTYTISLFDGKNTYTDEQSVLFKHKLYYGSSMNTTVDNDEILDFNQRFDMDEKSGICDFDCSGGKYMFFCIPTNRAENIKFKLSGSFSGMIKTNIQLTNASGYTSPYSIFRCNNLQHASCIRLEYFYNE